MYLLIFQLNSYEFKLEKSHDFSNITLNLRTLE